MIIHISIYYFCFSVCMTNLLHKILGNANKHLVNTYKFLLNFFMLTNLNLISGIMISFRWCITRYFPASAEAST
jgi:hypothetical protein